MDGKEIAVHHAGNLADIAYYWQNHQIGELVAAMEELTKREQTAIANLIDALSQTPLPF